MPEINEIEFEGELTLDYFSEADNSSRLRLDGKNMDTIMAEMLDFPSSEEWDQIFTKLGQMREKGMQPDGSEPDLTRSAGRYKIKIEKVE